MVKITVSAAGKPSGLTRGLPMTIDLADKTSETAIVEEVKKAVAAKFPKLYTSRQKLSLPGDKKALADQDTLARAGVADGSELNLKDLGPQLGWRFVYIVEYLGPLVIHPLIYFYPKLFYGVDVQHSCMQKYIYGMVMLHFIKRELETVFVHRFSHGTMPFFNIFKNSFHYHVLGGLFLAYSLYSPTYSETSPYMHNSIRNNETSLWIAAAAFVFFELSNFSTHMTLRNLRPAGTTKRGIPFGWGFSLVSCPNYYFESLAWLTIAALSGSYTAWFFWAIGTKTMAGWAVKRHRAYKKEFGDAYPKARKAMFPFFY